MNNLILSELARSWRAKTEHTGDTNFASDDSEQSRALEKMNDAALKAADNTFHKCSDDLEAVIKLYGDLD